MDKYMKNGNDKYMPKGMGGKVMGHACAVKPIETCQAEKYDVKRLKMMPQNSKGYNSQAWDYKY